MFSMLFKMTAVTALYVLVTVLVWVKTDGKKMTTKMRIAIGIIFGLCAIISTHFGVDYKDMMLNVRDLGPLMAGMYFDPLAGILAGLIGGIERYIVGTYFNVGSYTRIACSVSTCLAGFVAAAVRKFLFTSKKPSPVYGLLLGMAMEVFHMYAIFITHHDDLRMAFYVVSICAGPMIIYTALGAAASADAIMAVTGDRGTPFWRIKKENLPLSKRFQLWLFLVTSCILLVTVVFAYIMQTGNALQLAQNTINNAAVTIKHTYKFYETENARKVQDRGKSIMSDARAIVSMLQQEGDFSEVDQMRADRLCKVFKLSGFHIFYNDGTPYEGAGTGNVYPVPVQQFLDRNADSMMYLAEDGQLIAMILCLDGMIQISASPETTDIVKEMSGDSFIHVGQEGSFDIIKTNGELITGSHLGKLLNERELRLLTEAEDGTYFIGNFFKVQCYCRVETLKFGVRLLVQIPLSEVYFERNIQMYENVLAAILLFTVIFTLVTLLVQKIVVKNLSLINADLAKITDGDLSVVVDVRSAYEFTCLSDDINKTVDTLKGYIDAAKKRIEQELEFARSIQDASLPKNFDIARNEFEIYAMMNPAKEVGGDFYDFFFISQNLAAFTIADVSGKGIPAALFMMRAKTAIRGTTEEYPDPEKVMQVVNNMLCDGNDADMFVTAWLGILDVRTGCMTCVNAGHEYPFLMRAGGDFELFREKHGMVLGGMKNMKFQKYEIQLHPGDKLFVYTDGVPEAINERVEQYGTDRMGIILNKVKYQTMKDVLPAVRKSVADFVGKAEQFDDITMLGITYYGMLYDDDRA